MAFPDNHHNQTATYWANTGPNGYGWYNFSSPVQIKVRWVDKHDLFVAEDGKEIISDAVVGIGRDMSPGDYLYLGTSTESNPANLDGAKEVRKFKKTPGITNSTIFRRRAWLRRR